MKAVNRTFIPNFWNPWLPMDLRVLAQLSRPVWEQIFRQTEIPASQDILPIANQIKVSLPLARWDVIGPLERPAQVPGR